MNNVIDNIQCEEFETFTLSDYFEEINKIFIEASLELIAYSRVSSFNSYRAAAQEAYGNAAEEMQEHMRRLEIVNFTQYLIFLEGLKAGIVYKK